VKRCTKCGRVKSLSEFYFVKSRERYDSLCKVCTAARNRSWRERNVEKNKQIMRAARFRDRYGITIEEYETLLEKQGGVCALCRKPCATGRRLAVDHDHSTGAVRALLCYRHNVGIGYFDESPELLRSAANYLEAHHARK
jgi:hypothetical protein